ncbi:MAG: hypothetical protein IPM42_05620 [Saprospiraceae bacterium]|nr:hypothetical protein [Saprospiraceae bacterium]
MFTVLNIAFPKPVKTLLKEVLESGSAKGEIWAGKKSVRAEESLTAGSLIRKAKRSRTKKF